MTNILNKKKPTNYYYTNVRRYDASWLSGSVDLYADLPNILDHNQEFWYVQNDSWTRLLGTLKRKWLYYSNWVTWEYIDSPLAASLVEANAWVLNDVYISPYTLEQLLWNVNNTSDINKPISIDTQAALNEKLTKETSRTILCTEWTSEPILYDTQPTYQVFEYTYWTTKYYRTIYNTYSSSTDVFYTNNTLTVPITSRVLSI